MKRLHVISSANPAAGGPIEGVKQIARVTEALGHTAEVACLDAPDAPWIAEFPLPIYALGPAKTGYAYASHLIPWLKENASRYDAVIVNGLWQYHGYATHTALRGTTIPYYVYCHGMLDPWFKHAFPLKHIKKYLYWLFAESRLLSDARAVFFTCEEERRLARESFSPYRCNEVVLNYGTAGPPPSSSPGADTDIFFAQYPELVDKRLLLFLSRIHPKKGCDLLIAAFASVAHHDPNLHLVIAGPDKDGWRSELEARAKEQGIADRITWTGMVSGTLKWGALRAAEAFILPSHQENFGIAVAEALACETPVLVSNKVNIWREIVDSGAGIVGEDTVAGTLHLLNEWLALPSLQRQAMRIKARNCFLEHFEIGQAGRSLIAALESQARTGAMVGNS